MVRREHLLKVIIFYKKFKDIKTSIKVTYKVTFEKVNLCEYVYTKNVCIYFMNARIIFARFIKIACMYLCIRNCMEILCKYVTDTLYNL